MLTMNQAILAKIETTYGTDPTPTASHGIAAILPAGFIKPRGELLTRDIVRSTLSPTSHVVGLKTVDISFQTELKGSGGTGVPEIDVLLRSAGFKYTLVSTGIHRYTPLSTEASIESCTVYAFVDGNRHRILGCRFNVQIDLTAGRYGMITWTGQGLYNTVAAVALVTPTLQSSTPPIVQSASFKFGSFSPKIETFSMNMNNVVSPRPDMNSSGGMFGFSLTGRAPSFTANPESELEATKSYWADWHTTTLQQVSMTIGSTQYNRVWIRGPKAAFRTIDYTDRTGRLLYGIDGAFYASAADGDDELRIQVS